jgi:peptidoglycan/LPS O-acetylase OafA/YrhL
MGFARFYLAICVLLMHADHLHELPLPRGRHAVQLFFVISGFYMAMILSGRYASLQNFYASRWARISTPYYVHFLAFVVLSLLIGAFSGQFLALQAYFSDPLSKNGLAGILAAATTNFTIFGQDAVLFFRDNAGEGLQFTSRFAAHLDPLWKYLVIPQCWTVSIELFFYALVPFLNRWKSLPLLLLCLGTFAFRIYAYEGLGLRHDPWMNRFFPFELGLFVVGMLSWRMHEFVNFSWIPKHFPLPAYAALLLVLEQA